MSTYSNWLQPALQNLLQRVVRFFHPRSSCTTTHISADVQKITLMRRAWRSLVEEPNNSIYSAASLALRVIFSVSHLWNLFSSFTGHSIPESEVKITSELIRTSESNVIGCAYQDRWDLYWCAGAILARCPSCHQWELNAGLLGASPLSHGCCFRLN